MAQRYSDSLSRLRMARGDCPECGERAEAHSQRTEFWLRWGCSLLPAGVLDRIRQFREDESATKAQDDVADSRPRTGAQANQDPRSGVTGHRDAERGLGGRE